MVFDRISSVDVTKIREVQQDLNKIVSSGLLSCFVDFFEQDSDTDSAFHFVPDFDYALNLPILCVLDDCSAIF
jgi:hypothetical protein